MKNITSLYDAREEVIKFYYDYSSMIFNAVYNEKHNTTKGTGLKTLTPEQMLQRLPIALAQVKAGNNSKLLFILSIKRNHQISIQ